jgi:hypothetical protein
MEKIPAGTNRTEVSEELPQGLERRLVLRLLAHWRTLCEERKYPSFADLDPDEIPDIWPFSFVLEILDDREEPVFRAVGDELAAYTDFLLTDRRVSEAPDHTLPGVAISYVDEMLEKRVPISRGGEFLKADGTKVLYRSILLPMSDDGETISGVLGAANCREIDAE